MRFHARVSFAEFIDSGVIMVKGLKVKLKNDKIKNENNPQKPIGVDKTYFF